MSVIFMTRNKRVSQEVSPDLINIQRRINYFYRQRLEKIDLIKSLFNSNTVVFGGLLRDLGAAGSRHFKSDIDLVSMETKSTLEKLLEKYNIIKNKYGGFRFSYYGQDFDIWSYEDTWAFREGLVEPSQSFDALLRTTFFNLDSSYFELSTKSFFASDDYISGINKGILDINLKENPFPKKMAERAIRYALDYNFSISYKLQLYIFENIYSLNVNKYFISSLIEHLNKDDKTPFYLPMQKDFLK